MLRRPDPLANPAPLIRRVYSYVAYHIGDGADAEDITSEVFERALRYRDSFDPSKGTPVSWLLGIARRRLTEPRQAPTPVDAEQFEVEDPTDLEETSVRRLSLERALATLSGRDRDLLALRYGADLTARQIAEVLEMRTNAVEVALHRALATLRDLMARDEPAEISFPPSVRVEPSPPV